MLQARPGLCGRVWFEAREIPAYDGGLRVECSLPDADAETLADALEARRAGGGHAWGTSLCEDEIDVQVKCMRLRLSAQEAAELARGIRRAIAWPEGHP